MALELVDVNLRHPNRLNARKKKLGCGCKMCKPHKGKWAHKFKDKDRDVVQRQNVGGGGEVG